MTTALAISDLTASVHETEILRGLDLEVPFGELHAIMGPNGSGKSTLCHVLTGKSEYEAAGSARIDGSELLGRSVDERARMGLLQGFQYPTEIPGVRLRAFLDEVAEERGLDGADFDRRLEEAAERFDVSKFLDRSVNDDLSGGEKKRSEIFQLSVLGPKVALLDEIDSGLDIDAVRSVAEAVEAMRGPDVAVVMITHYSRILRYVNVDRIHVMIDGRIVESGGPELADELETGGYDAIRERLGIPKVAAGAAGAAEKRPSDFFTDTPFDA